MAEHDKYPDDSDRRRFVKGVVGSAALAGVGAASASAINLATSPVGEGGGLTTFYGVERIAGPAPRGMPQIPVEIDDEGYVRGRWPEAQTIQEQGREVTIAEEQLGGITYSADWFQYCGVQEYPGVQPDADQDNYFRYSGSTYDWQSEEVEEGDRVNVEHFEDYEDWGNDIGSDGVGKPAEVTWRSEDLESGESEMPAIVIRSSRIEEAAQNNEWMGASTQDGFFAYLNKCTHFCCVPGYKATEGSAQYNAEDRIYCQCHQSVYDPFSIVQETFPALPRPEED